MTKPAKPKSKSKTMPKRTTKAAARKAVSVKPAAPPVLLRDGKSIRMNLHDVIKVVKMIEAKGHLRRFTSKLKSQEAEVTVPSDTVNLVKKFVIEKGMHTSAIGKHIAYGRRHTPPAGIAIAQRTLAEDDGDPGKCHF